jgi:hypothetical protein
MYIIGTYEFAKLYLKRNRAKQLHPTMYFQFNP